MLALHKRINISLLIVLVAGFTVSQSGLAKADTHSASGALDGMVFVGPMGESNEENYEDSLSFESGMFWSDLCIRCGFKPGKYWTRSEPDGIHFHGEIEGDFGTFVYEGKIVDGKANVDVIWQKKRWYWTSSLNLSFIGSTRSGVSAFPISQANQIATNAFLSKLPDFYW